MPAGAPKHRARRFNAGLKLAATLANSLSIATFGAAFVIPIAQRDHDVLSDGGWTLKNVPHLDPGPVGVGLRPPIELSPELKRGVDVSMLRH